MKRLLHHLSVATVIALVGGGCNKDKKEEELAEAIAAAEGSAAAAAKAGQAAGAAGAQAGAAGAQAGAQAVAAAAKAIQAAQAAGKAGDKAAAGGQAAAGQAAAQAMAGVLGALGGATGAAGGAHKKLGKVVNWRKIAPYAPDKLGAYAAAEPLHGSTTGIGGMETSRVRRRYAAGDKKLRLEIVDTAMVPMLRSAFAMTQAIRRDSTEGIARGMKVAGQPAVVEWRSASKKAKLTVLVGARFLISLGLRPVDGIDEAVAAAKAIDLASLAKLKAE